MLFQVFTFELAVIVSRVPTAVAPPLHSKALPAAAAAAAPAGRASRHLGDEMRKLPGSSGTAERQTLPD